MAEAFNGAQISGQGLREEADLHSVIAPLSAVHTYRRSARAGASLPREDVQAYIHMIGLHEMRTRPAKRKKGAIKLRLSKCKEDNGTHQSGQTLLRRSAINLHAFSPLFRHI